MKNQISWIEKENSNKELEKILNPSVKKWFKNKFPSFAPAQKVGVMPIHSRENILISSPTGSGKTLTGFLSIINELVDSAEKGIIEDKVYAIYISPLKALGYDIEHNLNTPLKEIEEQIGKNLGIRVGVRTGDTSSYQRQKMNKTPPHILITTPESIALMLASKNSKKILEKVDWVILDEIHALAENKRGTHLSLMLEHLQEQSPGMTRIGLSATVAPLEEVAKFLAGTNRNCKIADISATKKLDLKVISPVDDLINCSYNKINENIYEKVHELIQTHKTTLIFTNTRASTEKIVHTLKQKFPKSYYEAEENPPFEHSSLIGAHHGSLSKEKRFEIEQKLRYGKLKCGVCSTSLELGIDIGSIDLVILLGSPKSVARGVQRAGRSGHSLSKTTKARIIVKDRDELVECAVLLKDAIEKHIDRIHIPTNSYDILAQHVLGFVMNRPVDINYLYKLTTESYCYKDLEKDKFNEIISYLAGEYPELEKRYIFPKIFKNEDNSISKRGRMTKMIYSQNLGTIASSGGITVKSGHYSLGMIDEGFLERLKRGDRFVLGGDVYEFLYSNGMTAQVKAAHNKSPNIPRWFSETLPLSFDLAKSIQITRKKIVQLFKEKKKQTEILKFISKYLYLDETTSKACYNYFEEEYLSTITHTQTIFPTNENLVVEEYVDELFNRENNHFLIFHSLHGRKVNESLSRVFRKSLEKIHHTEIEVCLNDNGFFLASSKKLDIKRAINLIEVNEFKALLLESIDGTDIFKRRFRQCAARSLMILRNYKGEIKQAGKQQISSMILLKTVKEIEGEFIILKETFREVTEDVMDLDNSINVFSEIKQGSKRISTHKTKIPTPFGTNLVIQGIADIVTPNDKHELLQNIHQLSLAQISANKRLDSKTRTNIANKLQELSKVPKTSFKKKKLTSTQKQLLAQLKEVKTIDPVKQEIAHLIKQEIDDSYILEQIINNQTALKEWPAKLRNFILNIARDNNQPVDYEKLWDAEEQKELEEKETEEYELKKDLAYAIKRRQTPPDIAEMIFKSLDKKEKPLKHLAKEYLEEEFEIKIHSAWSDKIYNYLKEKLEIKD